jgi:hypothetical protein
LACLATLAVNMTAAVEPVASPAWVPAFAGMSGVERMVCGHNRAAAGDV